MSKIAIVGSRNYPHLREVRDFVYTLPPETTVVTGGAKGVDITAEHAARTRGLGLLVFYPDWKTLGRSAGIVRNRLIVENSDELVAFWDLVSSGTKSSIDYAQSLGKRVRVIASGRRASRNQV